MGHMMYRTSSYAEGEFDYYLLEKDVFGNIVAVYNESGTKVVSYCYDAWGNCTVVTNTDSHAALNPFRYRGYYLDTETNLYYLQTRYYDPYVGRFINADDPSYLGAGDELLSYNLFSYCFDNPVMGYDPTGTWDWSKFFSGANLLMVGISAVAIAATVLTCGAAAPVMVAVAAVTLVSGAATVVNGVAEIVEAGTGYNVVRDGIFDGNQEAYDIYKNVTQTVAEVGTMICGTYYAANGGNVCFVAGTLIATAAGHIAIEEIQAGDWVWATDPETGETELKQVVQTFRNETTELVHVTVNGEEIVCTPTHPFYVPQKGWIAAIQLRAGDRLQLLNGEYVVIEQVQHEILESPVTTYNFEVEGFHTYFVGETGVLVHNKCGKPEVHHIVEQSQIKKSGFSSDLIQSSSNKVTLDYNIHRQISGYYSSKPNYTNGLRVRDWLAGQSFDEQTTFGWDIIRKFRGY